MKIEYLFMIKNRLRLFFEQVLNFELDKLNYVFYFCKAL